MNGKFYTAQKLKRANNNNKYLCYASVLPSGFPATVAVEGL